MRLSVPSDFLPAYDSVGNEAAFENITDLFALNGEDSLGPFKD